MFKVQHKGHGMFKAHSAHQIGGGFLSDVASKITGKMPGLASIQNLIRNHGSAKITNINVIRTPIRSLLTGAVNALSGGKLNEATNRLNYDKLYHLGMIIGLNDGFYFKIEKNEAITIVDRAKPPSNAEIRTVPGVLPRGQRLDTAIDNCQHSMGLDFYSYSALDNNCQKFVSMFLKSNGWLTPEIQTFVMQDVNAIKDSLPPYMNGLMNGLTDFAGAITGLRGN